MENLSKDNYVEKAKEILDFTRSQIVKSVNKSMTFAYFQIGKIIVEEEQLGKTRATYSEKTIQQLSDKLSEEYGRGFSKRNLEFMRKFYLVYSKALLNKTEENKEQQNNLSKTKTVFSQFQILDFQLSWSHYLILTAISNLIFSIATCFSSWIKC